MKRNKYILLATACLAMLGASCNDGYEKEPVENFTLGYVFSSTDSVGTQARKFMNAIYTMLDNGHNGIGGDYIDAASDDAISINQNDPDVYKLVMGRYSANDRIGADMKWGDYYKAIRRCNIMINNIDVVPFNLTYVNADGETQPLNKTMKSEARFLRAHFYFELVKRYGGVPLVGDQVFEIGDNLELPRNTFEECIDYIVKELDAAKIDLRGCPMADASQYGHVPTRETCMAMKSRVLLYAASPLFNESPIETNNEYVGYATYDVNRWKLAADAAKEFIETYGHKGSKAINLTSDFRDVFLGFYNISSNPEVIWFRQGENGHTVESTNGPLGFKGNAMGTGRTLPTQNLVESFPMKDGKMIGEGSRYTYVFNSQYDNRDPRLDYTVLHNGSKWLGTRLETFQGGANNASAAQSCRTSYYMSKFMGKYADNGATEYSSTYHLWVMYRYAEILLNYAEAANEASPAPTQDVYDMLIMLRKRAGIEAGEDSMYGLKANMTQEEMRNVIRNERRIEMAFEGQRYWDIRRWKIAEEVFSKPLRGLVIMSSSGQLNCNEVDVLKTTFEPYRYLYPIPYSEVVKNSNMKQNPKW